MDKQLEREREFTWGRQHDRNLKFIKSLGFYPQSASFDHKLYDEDRLQMHVMDCVGALVFYQRMFDSLNVLSDDALCAKRRLFWQTLMQVSSSLAENKRTNEALNTVLESFPDEKKATDGRSWLPLHFAVSLEQTNPADITTIFLSNTESIKEGTDARQINPCHLFAISENSDLKLLQQLKIYNSRLGQSETSNGNTPLHLAALHSTSIALIKELIQIHPPALRMVNESGETPFDLVFENTTSMAPNILRAFLQIDPALIRRPNGAKNDQVSIHCCVQSSDNPNVLELLSILLEADNDLVNVPTSRELLPIHLAARHSTVEVMKALYERSKTSINVIVPDWGSVAHQASRGLQLENLEYIHSIDPELLLLANNFNATPLHTALMEEEADCDFIKAVYALAPTAITSVDLS